MEGNAGFGDFSRRRASRRSARSRRLFLRRGRSPWSPASRARTSAPGRPPTSDILLLVPLRIAGFSIYATTLSAITFMSTPKSISNSTSLVGNIAIVAIIPLLIYFYVPFFKKLNVTSAYEYLEARFGPSVRVIGSLLFVLFHIGRVAIVIYLPTLAITAVSDIILMWLHYSYNICILYTFLGGCEGVVWSDLFKQYVVGLRVRQLRIARPPRELASFTSSRISAADGTISCSSTDAVGAGTATMTASTRRPAPGRSGQSNDRWTPPAC